MNALLQRLRNVSSNYVSVAVHGLIVILLTPYVVNELGVAQYAVWIIVQTIGYYLGFLDLGVADAQVQRHSVLQARGATTELGRLHGTVLTFFAGAGLIALSISLVLVAFPTAALFDIPPGSEGAYAVVVPLIGLAVLLSFVESALDGLYEGYQRYDVMNAVDIVLAVLEALAMFAVLYFGYGLAELAAVTVGGHAAAVGVKALVARRVFPRHAFPKLGFDGGIWRSIRGFSLWNSLNDLVTEGTANFDKLLIPILLASALVTPYSLIVTVAALVFAVAEPITQTFFPLAARRHGSGDRVALGVLMSRGSRLVHVATLPTTIVLLCFGQPILDLWIGAEIVDVAPQVLWFTVVSFFFSTYLWTSLSVLMGSGHVQRVFWTSVLEVAMVVALLVAFVPRLGLTGFALAGLVANVATGFGFFVRSACRLAGLSFWPFVLRTMLVPIVGAFPALGIGLWLQRSVGPETWLWMVVCVAITAGSGVVGVVAVGTSRWERARYWAAFQRLWRQRRSSVD